MNLNFDLIQIGLPNTAVIAALVSLPLFSLLVPAVY